MKDRHQIKFQKEGREGNRPAKWKDEIGNAADEKIEVNRERDTSRMYRGQIKKEMRRRI